MDIELAYLVQGSLSSICGWSGLVDFSWQDMAGMLALMFWTSAVLNIGYFTAWHINKRMEKVEEVEYQDFFMVMRLAGVPMNEPVYNFVPKKSDKLVRAATSVDWNLFHMLDTNTFGVKEHGFVVALPHIMIT